MACRHTSLPALLDRVCGHDFCKARKRIIGFITMAVNVPVKLLRQGKGIMDILNAHIACPLVVWNAAHKVTAKLHGFAHELPPIGKR